MKLIPIINFIKLTSIKYSIDESHNLLHSMKVLNYAKDIYNYELLNNSFLLNEKKIIYTSALLHDMCDKKYVTVSEGINNIINFLISEKYTENEIKAIVQIISTISYSYVKKHGFPNFNELKINSLSYHIVREADLLSAIDFDRCILYNINKLNGNIETAYENSLEIFNNRILKHNDDNLYITNYSKNIDLILKKEALERINSWTELIKS